MTLNPGIVLLEDHMRKMQELELNTSLGLLSHLTITMMNNCIDMMSVGSQCEIFKFQGDCLFENKEYKKALSVYTKSLQLYKSVSKMKSKQNLISLQQVVSDVDIKYKIHQCSLALNNDYEAISILEDIPPKSRVPKVHYAMAKLYQKMNMDKSAIFNYKEVLKACPLALDCAVELLRLGEHPNIVISIMSIHCSLDWLVPYIKAHGVKLSKDYTKSMSAFEGLSKHNSIRGNPSVLCDLAIACYLSGDRESAMQHFKSCHLQDPLWLPGMDLYSYLLCEDEQKDELDKLSSSLFSASKLHPEPLVAMGYLAKLRGEIEKAIYLAARATELDASCIQALLLKGVSLRMLGESKKIAVLHFRQALTLAPNRIDCYSELVNCYVEDQRNNEALNIAKTALDSVGYTPDSLVLCASTLVSDSAYDQAVRMVERALNINPHHLGAIQLRCSIALRQEKYADAIKLLEEAVQRYGSSKLHTMLANCYLETSKFSEAVDHYNIAVSLNSNNNEAKAGLDKVYVLEQNSNYDSQRSEELRAQDTSVGDTINAVSWPHDDWF